MLFKNKENEIEQPQEQQATPEIQEAQQNETLSSEENPIENPIENPKETADLEQAKRNMEASKMLSARFGEIVSLLMRTPNYKHYTLADMEWMVVPPLLLNQVVVAEANMKEQGISVPVGMAVWASVSDEVDAKLSGQLDRAVRLRPDEWRSGEHLWLIDVVGPPQVVKGLMDQLSENVFGGKAYKVRFKESGEKTSIRVVGK